MTTPLTFAGDATGILLCPVCGDNYVHLDDVYVAGRSREDGDIKPVHVDHTGTVRPGPVAALPIPDAGRRHAFSLTGYCEGCDGRFAIEFKQHKGQTIVRVYVPQWNPIDISD